MYRIRRRGAPTSGRVRGSDSSPPYRVVVRFKYAQTKCLALRKRLTFYLHMWTSMLNPGDPPAELPLQRIASKSKSRLHPSYARRVSRARAMGARQTWNQSYSGSSTPRAARAARAAKMVLAARHDQAQHRCRLPTSTARRRCVALRDPCSDSHPRPHCYAHEVHSHCAPIQQSIQTGSAQSRYRCGRQRARTPLR